MYRGCSAKLVKSRQAGKQTGPGRQPVELHITWSEGPHTRSPVFVAVVVLHPPQLRGPFMGEGDDGDVAMDGSASAAINGHAGAGEGAGAGAAAGGGDGGGTGVWREPPATSPIMGSGTGPLCPVWVNVLAPNEAASGAWALSKYTVFQGVTQQAQRVRRGRACVLFVLCRASGCGGAGGSCVGIVRVSGYDTVYRLIEGRKPGA